jgi:hypothetical protein
VTCIRISDSMILFVAPYTHHWETARNFSFIADLHTLQSILSLSLSLSHTHTHAHTHTHTHTRFSVFTSCILATDFNTVIIPLSHMKSSLDSLIPFLPFLLNYSANYQLQNSTQFYAATANSGTQSNCDSSCVRSSLYSLEADPQKTPLPLFLCVYIRARRPADPQRRPLAALLLLLQVVTAYVKGYTAACLATIT